MGRIERILAATDFSSRAGRALRRAALLAAEHQAELYLLHVLPTLPLETFRHLLSATPLETEQELYDWARAELHRQANELARPGLVIHHHVAIGRAHVEINRQAESHGVDLIVIGDQGENLAQEIFFGTTASKTLRKGVRPLLIVRQEPQTPYARVLVPVDFSRLSRMALNMALEIAPRTPVQVLHAHETPFEHKMRQAGFAEETIQAYRGIVLDAARKSLDELIAACAPGNPRVVPIIQHGYPPVVIQERARFLDADLVVIGRRGATELDEALWGSTTKHALYETACDVLVVSA